MTFSLNMRGTGYVTSYAAAVAMYDRATPWRGDDPTAERPLPTKRTRNMGVRMVGSDVVFRYHQTDVIRWREDESYTVNTGGYATQSTCEFASHFMPQRHWLTKCTAHLIIDEWTYAVVGHEVTVSGTGAVSGHGLGAFEAKRVNRANAKRLLADIGYPEYRDWYNVMYPMVRDTMPRMWQRESYSAHQMVSMLRDKDSWHALMVSYSSELSTLRSIMYDYQGREYGVWDFTQHDRVAGRDVPRSYTVTTA